MARNRASERRPPMRDHAPASDPLALPAFTDAALAEAVRLARVRHQDAKAAVLTVRGKVGRKAASRAVGQAARAVADAEAAIVRETQGEEAAPAVQRGEVMQGNTVLREPRLVVTPGRRAELQPALERLLNRGAISNYLYKAARRYRHACERAGRDAYPISLSNPDGGRSPPSSGNRRIEEALGSPLERDAARRAVGVFGTALLEHVVMEDLTLASWAERKGVSEHVAKGMFVMVLERLGEHWAAVRAAQEQVEVEKNP